MMHKPWQWFQFQLEQFIVRGPFHRLLVMALMIAAVALFGGLAVFGTGDFRTLEEAVWWAFLRLTDPGYLGDDEGIVRRLVSTLITVLGYVLFMGALIAIMTQWFQATMARIESGTSPASLRNHFVVLGWTNRTIAIVEELLRSETRVRSFYARLGQQVGRRVGRSEGLRVAILSDEPAAHVREELHRVLGHRYDPDQVLVRVGSGLRAEHLRRVDFLHAAAVLLPADPEGAEHPTNLDAITVKTLLSTMTAARELAGDDKTLMPLVVAELTDERKVHIATRAYSGPLATLAADRINSRLIAQAVRHHGVSAIYQDFLAHAWGNEIYVRIWRKPAAPFRVVAGSYRNALPIGAASGEDGALDISMNPGLDRIVETGDRVILLAPDHDATEVRTDDGVFADVEVLEPPPRKKMPVNRRVLILGWSRKAPVLLGEFDDYDVERFEVDLMSLTPVEEREREIERRHGDLRQTKIRHIEADFTSESDLEEIDLGSYETILFLSSDWLTADELADARTLLGYLVVQSVLERGGHTPAIVVELRDPESAELLNGGGRDDVIVSPEMSSHMLTHIALRRELGEVFEELFGPHGTEIFFLPIASYAIDPGPATFAAIRQQVAVYGECALGVRIAGSVRLNPGSAEVFDLEATDEIVVLAVFEPEQR